MFDINNFNLVKITEVCKGRVEKVMDIEVDHPDHYFLAQSENGAMGISHNSALISLSNLSDDRMRMAKSGAWWEENVQRALANNSVAYTEKPEIGIFMKEWLSLYESKSGERGIFNRKAALNLMPERRKKFGYEDFGTNPCLHPDSIVETIKGRMKIKDITEPTMVYSMGHDGKLCIRPCSASWVSKKNANTLKIRIASGKEVICTPDHKIFIENKGWIEAQDIRIGDRAVQLVRARRGARYSGVKLTTQGKRDFVMEHRLVYESYYGPIPEGYDVHHIDGDSYNNDFENLECLSHVDHARLTALEQPNNHMVTGYHPNGYYGFISPPNSKRGAAIIIPIPEELKSNLHQYATVIAIKEGPITDVYDLYVEDTHNFIANFIVVHNCSEIVLRSGQFCNLSEVVIRQDDTLDSLKEKVKNATILGTLQSTLTNFRYISKEWKRNTEEEALLGVSFTGIMDHEVMNGNRGEEILKVWLEELKQVAIRVNEDYAERLGVNVSAAITCVKPSGCGSLDNRISTTNGIISMRDLFKFNEVYLDQVDQGTWIEPEIDVFVHDHNGDVQRVTKLYVNGYAELYEITDDYGNSYKFTAEHKLWFNNEWVTMEQLSKVVGLKIQKVEPEITVDIEVENTHSYLLSNGWASHNTVSQLVDSASGIHPRYSPYYIRTVRADVKDPSAQFMKEKGFVCEPDVTKPDNTLVFSFPMKSPRHSVFRDDRTAIEQLELWKIYQLYWCEHKPSVTIYVKEHEWMEVGAWVYKNFDILSGVSFLPHSNHVYKQAPYQECTKEEYEELLEKYSGIEINWEELAQYEQEDYTTSAKELACVSGVCEI